MSEQAPEVKEEDVEGREVFVARDKSGVTAVSEHEAGADPRVTPDGDSDRSDEEDGGGD